MREIKFRAWVDDFAPDYGDKKESVMFYSIRANTTQMQGDRRLVCCGKNAPEGVLESFLENPRTPVMQYTGLKDKNGKEIYEGDMLRVDWNDSRYPIHNIGPVEWDAEEACWELGEGGEPMSDAKNHMEVIGNIYENPELLK